MTGRLRKRGRSHRIYGVVEVMGNKARMVMIVDRCNKVNRDIRRPDT